ncbi:MAG: GAF domain-containing protein, partial [bacterium]|nr:GAF domain-containing protein [bacterium]
EILDFSSVIKASQAISEEIELDKLLIEMMKIIMENAAADRAFIILEDKGKLLVEAEKESEKEKTTALKSIPVDTHQGLSSAIVNYVARTRETLILNNVVKEGEFTGDPYIINKQPKSLLCRAIINQGQLTGILYLENNHTTGAFTEDRIKILDILSTQAAISIGNSRLVATEKEKAELEKKHKEAQFKLLQDRMSPHFLFNSLNHITYLVDENSELAKKAIFKLADNYRFLVDQSNHTLISFDEEWNFVENYLKLDQVLYPDRRSFRMKRKGDFEAVVLPPLTLQPIVENCLKHGLENKAGKGFIEVFAEKKGEEVRIEVLDNGVGLKTGNLFSRSLGNILKRLQHHYEYSDLNIQNREKGGVQVLVYFSEKKQMTT